MVDERQSPTGHDGKAQIELLLGLLKGQDGGVAGDKEKYSVVVGGDRRDFSGTAIGFAKVSPGGDGDSERSLDVSLEESEPNMLPSSMLLETRITDDFP